MTRYIRTLRRLSLIAGMGMAVLGLGACDPSATGGSSAYYDAVIWNDYYYGHPRPPVQRPPRPEHPIARPPVARPPIHRPPVARPMPARL